MTDAPADALGQTDGVRKWLLQLLSSGEPAYKLPEGAVIPVLLLGGTDVRRVSAIDTNNRLMVNTGAADIAQSPAISALLDTGAAAGNSALSAAAIAGTEVYELWGFAYGYDADATVATRTTQPAILNGLLPVPSLFEALTQESFRSPQLTLTQSQEGTEVLETGGTVVNNDNGAVTYTTGQLEFPMLAINSIGISISVAAATNGVAGDAHRAILYGRQVA